MTDLAYYINPANVKQCLETKEYFLPIPPDWYLYFSNKAVACSVKYILPCIKHSLLWILLFFFVSMCAPEVCLVSTQSQSSNYSTNGYHYTN